MMGFAFDVFFGVFGVVFFLELTFFLPCCDVFVYSLVVLIKL